MADGGYILTGNATERVFVSLDQVFEYLLSFYEGREEKGITPKTYGKVTINRELPKPEVESNQEVTKTEFEGLFFSEKAIKEIEEINPELAKALRINYEDYTKNRWVKEHPIEPLLIITATEIPFVKIS